MINEKSVAAVDSATFARRFRRPCYESYSFSRIPGTVANLLDANSMRLPALPQETYPSLRQPPRNVVFFYFDAFGWQNLSRLLKSSPLLSRAMDQGVISKLTSQYPSSTAVHVTTTFTGLPPGQSGVYEWFQYEPKLGQVIVPLKQQFAHSRDRQLSEAGFGAVDLLPTRRFFAELRAEKIETTVIISKHYANSPYNLEAARGSSCLEFDHVIEGLKLLRAKLNEPGLNRRYIYFYYDGLDKVSHEFGPESVQARTEAYDILAEVERAFADHESFASGDTVLLLSADHGHAPINAARTFYLDRKYPELVKRLQHSVAGEPIAPAGSRRNFYLHVKEEYLDRTEHDLAEILKGIADVQRSSRLIEEGLFGPKPYSEAFLARVGNLAILPYRGESVFWSQNGMFERYYLGEHGGMSPEEMEIPLVALRYQGRSFLSYYGKSFEKPE